MFDNTVKLNAVRSADLAFRSIECGLLVHPVENLSFRYTDFGAASLDLNPQNMFAQAARNHSDIFIKKFLETFQEDSYDSAMAAAHEALMNMPATASTSDISFRDLSIIINTANKGGFADLDDLRKSDLSDFMKEYLEDDWLFKQQSIREWNKEGGKLLEERKKLFEQRWEIRGSNLSEKEKEAQLKAIEELMLANLDKTVAVMNKLPGAGSYRMYHL
jgi:hypothetical protein